MPDQRLPRDLQELLMPVSFGVVQWARSAFRGKAQEGRHLKVRSRQFPIASRTQFL